MPKTPHSSRGPSRWSFTAARMPSQWSRLAAALDPLRQPAVPRRAQLGDPELKQALDGQALTADLADHDEAGEGLARTGHDERTTGRLPERIDPARQPHRRAQP